MSRLSYCALFIFLVLLFLPHGKISAQNVNSSLLIDSVANLLEQKRNISLYYKAEWFQNKKLHSSIINLSINELINVLKNACNCSTVTFDSTSVVFTSNDLSATASNSSALSYITIGNPKEYGKYSKAIINGKVIDSKTGEPLTGARIFIDKIKLGAATDKNGNFTMTLPVGDYNAKLSYIGYQDGQSKLKVLGSGSATFEVIEKSINLDEVVISSKRLDNNLLSPKMGVVKMNKKDIKELPFTFGETDIIKSVTLLPGVVSIGEFGTGFNVRGGGADQNLILVEGVPIFNSAHLFGLTSIVNPDAVSNVTLYKAGIPSKYGERASSVMDIQLGTTNSEKIKANGGIGLINSRLTVDAPLLKNKINLLVGGRATYSDWLLHEMPDIDLKNSSAKFYDLNGFLTISPDQNNKIVLFGYYSNDDFMFGKDTRYNYNNMLSSIKWNHVINQKLSSSLLVGYSKYNYQVAGVDTFKKSEAYRVKSEVLYQNAKWNFSWHPTTDHSIDVGIAGVLYNLKPGDLKPYDQLSKIIPIHVQNEKAGEFAIYASDEYSLSQKLGMEIGVRYSLYWLLGPRNVNIFKPGSPVEFDNMIDTVSYSNNKIIKQYSGFEPRFSIRYSIDDKSSVKISYNRINQYINLVSNSSVMMPSDVWKLSDKYLKPLKCDQIGIGYFRNFQDNMYETSLELYYKSLTDVIEYKNGAQILLNDHIETDLVNAKGYNYGAELYVKKNSGRLTGWASYTYSRSMRKTTSEVVSEQINNNNIFPSNFDKPHNLVINGNYHISRRWRFSWSFLYSTGRPETYPELKYKYQGYQLVYYSERNKYRLPDYHRLDVSITLDESLRLKKKWKGCWTFSIINLYGRQNVYSSFYQIDNTVSLDNPNGNNYGLYKLMIIAKPLPTLTYNFSF